MQIGDMVKCCYAGYGPEIGWLGLIVEEEVNKRELIAGYWVWYFKQPDWHWYSYDECDRLEVVSV